MPKDTGSSNERYIWAIFMNAPKDEALRLYAEATKILTARNILAPPRKKRAPKIDIAIKPLEK